jgi:YVTN family beta-propeller protein
MKILPLVLLALSINLSAQTQISNYKIINKTQLDGDGSWDYLTVDEPNDRLFISHGTMVHVLDLKTQKQTGVINNTKGVHGIALAHNLNKGFTSNGKDSSVTIFDLKTLKILSVVKVTGAKPDAILYDKFSNKLFVYNGKSNNVTVINPESEKVIGTISLEGIPEFSVTDEKGKVYVNIEDKNSIAVINANSLKVEHYWKLNTGEEPSGLAIDIKTNRLFSVCSNKLMIIMDAQTGKVISTLPIGDHCDGVVFDPTSRMIFASNGEGTITVIKEENANTFKVFETIKTQKGAKTIAFNPKTNHVFVSAAEFGKTPEPTKENPEPKPSIKPNTFVVMEIEQVK